MSRVETVVCGECDARFDLAERVGTTCRYVEFCPACGSRDVEIEGEQ